jgi:hypothetical protein
MLVDINGLQNSTYIDVSYLYICAEFFLDRKQTKTMCTHLAAR